MIVLDANLLVALVSGDPRGDKVQQHLLNWLTDGEELYAPSLARYEIANALTRLIVAGMFPLEKVETAWSDISILPIIYNATIDAKRVIEIALNLGRQNAYDASYIALAESLGAGLWTLDGSLYRNAVGQGFSVQLIN